MSRTTEPLPGFWRFLWLFWMQPITLHRLLRRLNIKPDKSGWKLLRHPTPEERWYLVRLAQVLMVAFPAAAGVLQLSGAPFSWGPVALSVAVNVAWGFVVGGVVAQGVATGVAGGMIGGVASGVVAGVWGPTGYVPGGAAAGVLVGVFMSAAMGVVTGVFTGVAWGIAMGVFVGVFVGVFSGVAEGVELGVEWTLEFVVTYLRLPFFVLECLAQSIVCAWSAVTGQHTLRWAPVLHHELSYLPHPFLAPHLLAEAESDPALTRRVLDACAVAPGQRRIGRGVEATLRARELARLAQARDFQAIAELRGTWLPGIEGADGVLLGFSEAGRYLAAATAAFNPHHQLTHLQGFESRINAIENQLRSGRSAATGSVAGAARLVFDEPLQALRSAAERLTQEARARSAGLLPNPFRAGEPLSGEAGPELFRGREAAVRDIEEILSDPDHSASLQLLAPRRSGKTSLLKMLPGMLPDCVCVFFDLQAHPAASVDRFVKSLAEQAKIQARRDRRIELPPLPAGPALEAAELWFEKLDQLPDGRRVLIAIDEFERLEDLFPGNRREFLQLMGLLRATIQHRRRVRLLVAGATTFDQLDGEWDDHFISARRITLPFLDRPTSVGLLTAPSADFPAGTIPDETAAEVHRRTGGQPFLLQIFGSLLISRLNEDKRKVAILADVDAAEERALEWADVYFRDLYRHAPEAAKVALNELARGHKPVMAPATRRWLAQQYLLTPDDGLAVPLFGTWIGHHAFVSA